MTQKNEISRNEKNAAEPPPAAKKPYSKPEFRYERVFETMAPACGKTEGIGFCKVHSKTS